MPEGGEDEHDASVCTIVPHELESVEEGDEEQMAKRQQQPRQEEEEEGDEEEEQEETRRRRADLARPRTPEPTGLGMTTHHLTLEDDEEPRQQQPSSSNSTIDQLCERLTTPSNQLESAVESPSSLRAQHIAAQSTISASELLAGFWCESTLNKRQMVKW